MRELNSLPGLIQKALELDDSIELLVERLVEKSHALFLGRGSYYRIAMEDALKRNEISYIHAEAYPAGELKHGPLVVQTEGNADIPPYTRAMARSAGWQWRIPLQHRAANGLVFCSAHQDEESAREELLGNLEGEPLPEPSLILRVTGRRRKARDKNVIAVGLSSGFLEPLEITSNRLIQLFPFSGNFGAMAAHYNAQTQYDFEHVRDFILLHYKLTHREDEPFWLSCSDLDIPGSLAECIQLFRDSGIIHRPSEELFRVASRLFVMVGQGVMPRAHHHMGALLGDQRLQTALDSLKQNIGKRWIGCLDTVISSLPAVLRRRANLIILSARIMSANGLNLRGLSRAGRIDSRHL